LLGISNLPYPISCKAWGITPNVLLSHQGGMGMPFNEGHDSCSINGLLVLFDVHDFDYCAFNIDLLANMLNFFYVVCKVDIIWQFLHYKIWIIVFSQGYCTDYPRVEDNLYSILE